MHPLLYVRLTTQQQPTPQPNDREGATRFMAGRPKIKSFVCVHVVAVAPVATHVSFLAIRHMQRRFKSRNVDKIVK